MGGVGKKYSKEKMFKRKNVWKKKEKYSKGVGMYSRDENISIPPPNKWKLIFLKKILKRKNVWKKKEKYSKGVGKKYSKEKMFKRKKCLEEKRNVFKGSRDVRQGQEYLHSASQQ